YPCMRTANPVITAARFLRVDVGGRSTCAIATDSTAYCWGLSDRGQLGSTSELTTCAGQPCSRKPIPVGGQLRFSTISIGVGHVCAVATSGGGYCWGDNTGGKLGSVTLADAHSPRRIADPKR